MGQAVDWGGLSMQPKVTRDLFVALVHHNHRHFSIRIYEGSGKKLASARCTRDSFSAGADELCKVSNIEIRVGVDHLAGSRIGVNGCEQEFFTRFGPPVSC